MGKIIAIGGGQFGQPKPDGTGNFPYETLSIDREIIRLSGKAHPRITFVPTASGDAERYFVNLRNYFTEKHGCTVEPLYLTREKYTRARLRDALLETDIIYVGGGNTLRMMRVWRAQGIDELLKEAYARGVVLAGLSAGAGCWFKGIISDSWRQATFDAPIKEDAPYINVRCLGIIPAIHAPHIDEDPKRLHAVKATLRRGGVAISLGNSAALEIVDGKYRVLLDNPHAQAYKSYWKGNRYHQDALVSSAVFQPMEQLLKK